MSNRFLMFVCPAMLSVISSLAAAQSHPEFVVACDASNKLVVKFDAEKPYPLPASRLDGIEGYADAMPGFLSVFVVREGENILPLDLKSDLEFVLLGADDGLRVLNDHGTGPMQTGEVFRLGNPPFDTHPVWHIAADASKKSYEMKMQVRDRSGRYQPSDVFAAKFAPDDATQVYVCPMRCQLGKQYAEPGACPVCEMRLKLYSGRNYRVTVTPRTKARENEVPGVHAGIPTPLDFEITAPDGGRVNDLEIVHEKLVHLLMVSEDLAWFAHEHPELQPDGKFTLTFAFPHGGKYVLYNDFTPSRAGMQVVPVELEVGGDKAAPVALKPSADRTTRVDGYTVKLTAATPLTSLRSQDLRVNISRDGKPVNDLEPFLGALGHLIVISEDRKHFVHSHPLPPTKSAGEPASSHGGPDVVFSAQFPAAGVYKSWAQFQHKGHVITAPFVIEVVSMLGRPAAVPREGGGR
jgi:hypothetical protein